MPRAFAYACVVRATLSLSLSLSRSSLALRSYRDAHTAVSVFFPTAHRAPSPLSSRSTTRSFARLAHTTANCVAPPKQFTPSRSDQSSNAATATRSSTAPALRRSAPQRVAQSVRAFGASRLPRRRRRRRRPSSSCATRPSSTSAQPHPSSTALLPWDRSGLFHPHSPQPPARAHTAHHYRSVRRKAQEEQALDGTPPLLE